jgi:hypothetical protein
MIMEEEAPIEVECIDLGRSILVQSQNKRWLSELPKDLASLPVFPRKCSLLFEPFGEHWCQRAMDKICRLQGSVGRASDCERRNKRTNNKRKTKRNSFSNLAAE